MTLSIKHASNADSDALWHILEPIIRAGETYPLPRDMSRDDALAYWLSQSHQTFTATSEGSVVGTYYIRPNNSGGGAHVANCGYMVGENARGKGVARAMCAHSIEVARQSGFKAIQFNFVIATNTRAVALWISCGFETLCTLPQVFDHPREGLVDALVMFKQLEF